MAKALAFGFDLFCIFGLADCMAPELLWKTVFFGTDAGPDEPGGPFAPADNVLAFRLGRSFCL